LNFSGSGKLVLVIAAVGISKSGKTTTLEYLISALTQLGLRVGTVKHVHHTGFTMDTQGTNTWRYAQAGSKVIVAISPEEIDIIRKTNAELKDFNKVITMLEEENLDVVFIEGFHSLIAKRTDVPKLVTAVDQIDLERTLEGTVQPILAITGIVAQNTKEKAFKGTPFIKVPTEGEKLVALIKNHLKGAP
jgi:molybdopterin-guanine dinucleotide biosynthesis adapter protein